MSQGIKLKVIHNASKPIEKHQLDVKLLNGLFLSLAHLDLMMDEHFTHKKPLSYENYNQGEGNTQVNFI